MRIPQDEILRNRILLLDKSVAKLKVQLEEVQARLDEYEYRFGQQITRAVKEQVNAKLQARKAARTPLQKAGN